MPGGCTSCETCWDFLCGARAIWGKARCGAIFPTSWLGEAASRCAGIYRKAKLRNSLELNARWLARCGPGCGGGAAGLLRDCDDRGAAFLRAGTWPHAAGLYA